MAARKKPPASESLFGSVHTVVTPAEYIDRDELLKLYPKHEETPVIAERTLCIVPPPVETPESDVVIEATGDGHFMVALLRHHGTTVAAVKYTRGQLEMLLRRIPAALEVG